MNRSISMILLAITSLQLKAELTLTYAPKAHHTFVSGAYINDDINLLSVSYDGVGAFTMTNSYHERTVGIYTTKNIHQFKRLSVNLIYGVMWGYLDSYYVNPGRTEIVTRGERVIRPIIAPTITYRNNDNASYSYSQYVNASVFAANMHF